MLKVAFLGTNGWFDTNCGNTVSLLIESDKEYVICDAGNGLYKIDRHIKTQKPIYLFISHFHLDHIIGLHVLAKFKFAQSLTIIAPPGGKQTLKTFAGKPFTVPLNQLPMPVKVLELNSSRLRLPFLERGLPLRHKGDCFGFRFNFDGQVISYVADTGLCPNVFTLARDANLLITECAFRPGKSNPQWPHLNPEMAAEIAQKSGAKKLALVHFDAHQYQKLVQRRQAEVAARKIFKNSFAMYDDQVIATF